MIEIKVNGIVIGTIEELTTTEINIMPGSKGHCKGVKFDKLQIQKIFDKDLMMQHSPMQIDEVVDDNGNVWQVKNAWISNINYNFDEGGAEVEDMDFICENLKLKGK